MFITHLFIRSHVLIRARLPRQGNRRSLHGTPGLYLPHGNPHAGKLLRQILRGSLLRKKILHVGTILILRQLHRKQVFIRGNFRNGADRGRGRDRLYGHGLNFRQLLKNLLGRRHKLHFHLPVLHGGQPQLLKMNGYQHGAQSHLNAHGHRHRNQHGGLGSGTGRESYNSGLFIHKKRAGRRAVPVQYTSALPFDKRLHRHKQPVIILLSAGKTHGHQ